MSDLTERIVVHVLLVGAVCFALYPVLWVIALALSGTPSPEASAIPYPAEATFDHFEAVATASKETSRTARCGCSGASCSTPSSSPWRHAAVGVLIAIPTAYALARFEFLGKATGVQALLATQMFPAVASAIPLYLILDALSLLNSRTGLVLCYASTSVPFAIFQLRAAFEAIPLDLEEAAMVDGATRFEGVREGGACPSPVPQSRSLPCSRS